MSATPILDLIKDPPAPPSSRPRTLIYIAACVAIGFIFTSTSFGQRLPGFDVLLWVPCLYVMIAVHELGHLAVGKITGMAPGGLVVGGFVAMKSGNHWSFRFDWRRALGGGLAVPLPAKQNYRVQDFAWMVAAGPAASVLSVLLCWLAFLRYGSGALDWIGSFFWAAAMGLLSLIPMSAGLHKSDAARLWML